ncbi:hypothetical protein ACHAW6_014689 [Cyclotella cf. meneghiniana]
MFVDHYSRLRPLPKPSRQSRHTSILQMNEENINLVLNLDTGHCPPQFHCRYDDFFETINLNKPGMMTSSNWQILAGLGHIMSQQSIRSSSHAIVFS